MVDQDAILDRVATAAVEHPGRIVAGFLVLTLVFGAGLGGVSTETGTSQFAEGTPAQDAYEDVNREFSPTFGAGTGSTQLVQRSQNVLSKPALLRMLRAQDRLAEREGLRVTSTSSVAQQVARAIDPQARTLDAQIRAIRDATPKQIDTTVARLADAPGFASSLSNDFNAQSASASATIGVVQHRLPGGLSASAGTSGTSPLQTIQTEAQHVVNAGGGDIRVFGSGIISAEFANVIFDSLVIVVPAAALLILAFLVFSYRDPFDLVLGVVSLLMAIVWTFGFMGLAGIPFTQMLIAVPPLLLAVGIDFGIHAVNRYREERVEGRRVRESMRTTVEQLTVAFFIVTGTTVLGFAANLTSSLGPIRDFGMVASIGIIFTFLIFGVFLPSAKVYVDRVRERRDIPQFGLRPLGEEGSVLGRVLPVGVGIARRAPRIFLALIVVLTVVSAGYGAGVDTSFQQEDFLPPSDVPDYLDGLPEPFKPSAYTSTQTIDYLEAHFETAQTSSTTIYVKGPLRRDYALESIQHANRDPPSEFITDGRQAEATSIISVIESYAEQNPEFRALVERNDADDDGVPDDNLREIYDALLDSPSGDRARSYLTSDYRSTRVVYSMKSSASQAAASMAARELAGDYRYPATATGQTVVFQAVSDTIFTSAIRSLTVALAATAAFLLLIYQLLEGRASLGLVNLAPIVVTLALIIGTMRFLGIPFNALTATVLSIAIGLGVDYSAHITHRFADEFDGKNRYNALYAAVRGTGGALTGSMLTTAFGIGVLVLAITPILGQFGTVTSLSIVYSYLTALVVTPSVIVVWDDVRKTVSA